ncbi:MAG: hypothetical protein A2808_01295 [Candidatus Moranbacteria bacterium RIFCSPHIGHO2_01_FULL_55_24]|nr:MAG: hypothetical protein A2808_01295 [Candidatus Moranbacteria bacterium RIFCSPHIGHO2_01_FULL_55_24]
MWYLIVPPIVIVVSLAFLLWYLSRKGSDPAVAEKISRMDQEGRVRPHFSRTKEFFLRLLEKAAQRSKTRSLRMHNRLHEWLQSIRASRKKVSESVVREREQKTAAPLVEEKEERREEAAIASQPRISSGLEMPIFRRRRDTGTAPLQKAVPEMEAFGRREMAVREEGERIERPMVSDQAAEPEGRKRRLRAQSPEEDLIARIAANPKDFSSYEALGDYYMETGNVKDAKECYRQVLKLSPVHRLVKIKIRRLEKFLTQR